MIDGQSLVSQSWKVTQDGDRRLNQKLAHEDTSGHQAESARFILEALL
jgi:hypothetical protein